MKEQVDWDDVSGLMGELKGLAQSLLRLESDARSLTPTALVLTALRRQVPSGKEWDEINWRNRKYFLGAMYQAMRRALIDHAKARQAVKRIKIRPVRIDEIQIQDLLGVVQEQPEQVEAALIALDRLREQDAELAEVVEHRFLAGYTIEETARIMEVGEKTIRRWWDKARALLYNEVQQILNNERE